MNGGGEGGGVRNAFEGRYWTVQALVALVAAGLLGLAVGLDRAWLERHILPEFFQPRDEQLAILNGVRAGLVVAALVLLWPVRPWLVRWAGKRTSGQMATDVLPTLLAVVLALAAAEGLLRVLPWYAVHELPAQREPQRRRDPVLGWTYLPDRAATDRMGGRTIAYAFDAAGHRVPRRGDAVDYAQPSVLFLGESIVAGHGLDWEETIPARVGSRLGLQPAVLAVGGYATDQMYLRFRQEWPRYREPRAVVILFMPRLLHRNLDRDRPHLTPGLAWRPASDAPRLRQLWERLVPYRTDREVDDAVRMTHAALAAMVADARARGAEPLILVPQLDQETPEEAAIRRRVLANLPFVHVDVDPAYHLPNNRHPDARGAARLADAVAADLEPRLAHHPSPNARPGR